MTTKSKEIARKVREAIAASGKSQNEWAKAAGISPAALSAFLRGFERGTRKSATIDTVQKIADAMGCPVSELMGDDSSPTSEPRSTPWPELDAALLYHPGRWHPDTVAAFRKLRAYQGLGFAPQEIEKRLDELDEVVRRFLDDKAKATQRSPKKKA